MLKSLIRSLCAYLMRSLKTNHKLIDGRPKYTCTVNLKRIRQFLLCFSFNLGQNRQFFAPCDIEIWQMTLKNNRAHPLCYFKLCASFRNHQWKQTGVTVRKRPIWLKISDFFVPCDLEIWQMTLKSNRAPLLCYFKLCVSFRSHQWNQTGVTVRKSPIRLKIGDFFVPYDLEIWQMTLKNNRVPLLIYFKLYA